MAGDVVFSATLKDDGVSRGLREIDQAAERSANKAAGLRQSFGSYGSAAARWAAPGFAAFKAIEGIIKLQTASMSSYAEVNDTVSRAIENRTAAQQKSLVNLGREMQGWSYLSESVNKYKINLIDAYTEAVKWTTLEVAKIGQGGQGAANVDMTNTALRIQEEQTREGKTSALVFMAGLKAQEEMMRNQDDILGADLIRARIQKLEELKAVADQVKKEGLTQDGASQLRSNVEDLYQSRVDKANAAEADRRKKEQEQIRQEAQASDKAFGEKNARYLAAQQAAEREVTVERELNALRGEAIGKSDKERQILEEKIALRQALYNIEKDSSLNAQQKEVLASEASLLSARQIEAVLSKSDERARVFSSSVSAGAGGVFGAGSLTGGSSVAGSQKSPGLDEARQAVKLAQEQVNKLREIADSMKRMASSSDVPKFAL